ncbi:MAG: DUF4115 domain-containing protein [Proteobacteria bacterium]|nr:DUF4115 domain-containing protein [Pseudomonadota bacterium]
MKNKIKIEPQALSVGKLLKEARESQGYSLEDITKSLCISKRHLISLEENNENLVCDVYTLGFLKSYAEFLGLDQNDLCKKFKEHTTLTEPSFPPFPAPVPGRGMPSRRILLFSFLILLAFIIGWRWQDYSSVPSQEVEMTEIHTELPEPPKVENVLPAAISTPSLEDLATVPSSSDITELIEPSAVVAEPPVSLSTVILKASQEAWIEVKDENGKIILSRIFKPEETYEFTEPKGLILKTGNAKGIQLYSGEQTLSFPNVSGAVKSNIPLDPEKWVEQRPETL